MVCDVTLVCAFVRKVMLSRELDQLAARIGSLLSAGLVDRS